MSNKIRNLTIMAAVLVFSALMWSAVAAQDATAEPTAEATEAAPTQEAAAPMTDMTPEVGTAMQAEEKPFLGVSLQEAADGVTVVEVVAGSGAEAAGLQAGDIITAVNGTAVTTIAEVADAINALKVGDTVTIDYTRGSDSLTATATLGTQVTLPMPGRNQGQNGPGNGNGQRGQRGQGLNRAQMFGFEYNSDDQSWTIQNLPDDSPLYTAGLRQGDVITAVDGESYTPANLMKYLMGLDANTEVKLTVTRDGASQEISVAVSDLMSGGFGGMGIMRGDFGNGNFGNGQPFDFSQMMPMMQFAYGNGRLGVAFEPIDADVAQQNNLTVTEGALITEVQDGTPAATAGLKVNDVVTAVNGEAVDEEHTLRDRLIAYEPGDTVTLTVLRDGASQDIQVTLDQPQMSDMGGMFNFHDFHGFPFDMQPGQTPDVTPEPTPNA